MLLKLHKLPLIILLAISLQGCVTAVVGSKAILADARPIKTLYNDEKLSSEVMSAINKNPLLKVVARINALVYQGEVMLVGQVPTADLKQEAVNIANGVSGVKKLYDRLTVGQPISGVRIIQDAAITSQIKSKLLVTSNIDSTNISVTTEDGVVYLMGYIDASKIPQIVHIARYISGVKMVVNAIQPQDNSSKFA